MRRPDTSDRVATALLGGRPDALEAHGRADLAAPVGHRAPVPAWVRPAEAVRRGARGGTRPTAPLRVDPALARDVAAHFVAGRSTPEEPLVAAAYAQLRAQSDRLWTSCTRQDQPGGIRVVFTRALEPYASDQEMIGAVRTDHLLEVTIAAAEPGRLHPLLGGEPGGVYDRFRAVHDLVGHVGPRLGFDRDGEYAAWLAQDRLHHGLARWALATELHGEHSVRWTTGVLAEHKAMLLDPFLLRRSRRCVVNPDRAPAARSRPHSV
jgi:hypothetical protein